ncbi:MAG: 50S ribosomal protein L15 [Acidobacteria bacterium]|nr:50S ribosomal protein L15 [Planctomycetota bacterium]MBE3135501.1 50S ribosomal protein L15 [Acidobacteriota bacterium]
MNLTDVKKSSKAHKPRTRVGRGIGSGRGKTSGRGHKGSKSRAGYSRGMAYEGGQMPLFRRLPKVGFSNVRFATPVTVLNVEDLNRFRKGTDVGVAELRKEGLVKGRLHRLKILGRGDLKKALTVRAHAFSASAAAKIAEAGGKAEVITA